MTDLIRVIFSIVTSAFVFIIFGNSIINRLKRLNIGQYIQQDGPPSHIVKQGTPTMGGIPIILISILSTVFFAKLTQHILICILSLLLFGAIGFVDDWIKIKRKENKGLTAKQKFLLQTISAFFISWLLYRTVDHTLYVPFFKTYLRTGIFYFLLTAFIIVATSNAVNLTDGLDGLAIVPISIAFGFYLIFSYVSGNKELAVFCGSIVGSGLGFLWYNTYPAELFMGDVGSLSLGAALATVSVITKQELLLLLIGGIFVIEAISVIVQVGYFKLSGGKRVFRMAPIHHHFEMKGLPEPKIIVRFWIVSVILAIIGIGALR